MYLSISITNLLYRFIALSIFIAGACSEAKACTSAIVAASANPYGRPLLWKNRDTSAIDNKVEYVPSSDGAYAYVALFNADDRRLEQAWIGMNEVGFAVMNTASYNIKNDQVPDSRMDREGFLMTVALRSCRTVDDFRRLLDSYPRPMGVEANFGVIDATGAGGYFETNNDSYVFFDLADAPGGVLVRTNYSHSGRKGEGFGQVRESNALHLLKPYIGIGEVTPELLTETLSRSFYHDIFGKDCSKTSEMWLIDQDFIPRYKSTATVVIEGCSPIDDASEIQPGDLVHEYIMWTGLGYPPCSEIVPVWCSEDGVDAELRGTGSNGHSPLCDRAKARRDEVFHLDEGNRDKYIDITLLYNAQGTGYAQVLSDRNLETYAAVRRQRDRNKHESYAKQ